MLKNILLALPFLIIGQVLVRDLEGPFFYSWTDSFLIIWLGLSIKVMGLKKTPLPFFSLSLIYLVGDYFANEGANLIALGAMGLCLIYWIIHFFIFTYKCLKKSNFRKLLLLSSASWLIVALAFPPLPLGVLIWGALVPWLYSLDKLDKKEGATLTFWASIPFNIIMHYWIYNVMKVGPVVTIAISLFLLVAYLSLYNVLGAWIYQSLSQKKKAFLFPIAWVGIEVIRTKGEISFPWGHLGYTLGLSDAWIQPTAWIGIFGLSALIIFSNQLTLKFWYSKNKSYLIKAAAIPLLLLVLGYIILFNQITPEKTAKIALAQPNISQLEKWDRKKYFDVLDRTWKITADITAEDSVDLMVLPETAIPNFSKRVPHILSRYQKKAESVNSEFFVGILDMDFKGIKAEKGGRRFFNTGRWLRPNPHKDSVYNKVFLVPFSERLPFDNVIPIINFLNFGEGDFTPGKTVPLYETKDFKWSPNICYESIYPFFIRDQVAMGSEIIVNITNDGWFGASTEPYQHLNLVRFRAAENGIPFARSTNTGVTAFINQYGQIESQTEIMVPSLLTKEIGLKNRTTLYSIIGDWVENLLFAVFFGICLIILGPKAKELYIFKQNKAKGA